MPKATNDSEFDIRQAGSSKFAGIEARALEDGQSGVSEIFGYAAVYGVPSRPFFQTDEYEFREIIEAGAFDEVLANDTADSDSTDTVARFNHRGMILARTSAGTLNLSSDANGLRFAFTPVDSDANRQMCASIRRGDLSEASFSFRVGRARFSEEHRNDKLIETRHIEQVRILRDISVVDWGAYAQPSTECRSHFEARAKISRRNNDFLRQKLELAAVA